MEQASTRRASKDKTGYQALSAADDEEEEEEEGEEEEGEEEEVVSGEDETATGRERGHGRSSSLDLNKMIATSSVLSDMPAAEPPRPPPVSTSPTPDPMSLSLSLSPEASG